MLIVIAILLGLILFAVAPDLVALLVAGGFAVAGVVIAIVIALTVASLIFGSAGDAWPWVFFGAAAIGILYAVFVVEPRLKVQETEKERARVATAALPDANALVSETFTSTPIAPVVQNGTNVASQSALARVRRSPAQSQIEWEEKIGVSGLADELMGFATRGLFGGLLASDPCPSFSEVRSRVIAAIQKIHELQATGTLDDNARVEMATVFVKETWLGCALVDLWQSVRHFPSWAKNGQVSNWNPLGATNISGDGQPAALRGASQAKKETVGFDWRGRSWMLTFIDSGGRSFDGLSGYAELTLNVDGDAVFEAEIQSGRDGGWYYKDMKAFVVGEWVADLAETQAIYAEDRLNRARETDAAQIAAKASKIKF